MYRLLLSWNDNVWTKTWQKRSKSLHFWFFFLVCRRQKRAQKHFKQNQPQKSLREKLFIYSLPKSSDTSQMAKHFTPRNVIQNHVQIWIVLQVSEILKIMFSQWKKHFPLCVILIEKAYLEVILQTDKEWKGNGL